MSAARVVAALPSTLATGGVIELSPFDIANKGRTIPMVWFYRETLDPAMLLASLRETLKSYPVLCGRYGTSGADGTGPDRVELTNEGVPVDIVHADMRLHEAVAHLPHHAEPPSIFAANAHLPFVPDKGGMDPDPGSAETPLLAVKVTCFHQAAPPGSPEANRRTGSPSFAARRSSGSLPCRTGWSRGGLEASAGPSPRGPRSARTRLLAFACRRLLRAPAAVSASLSQ